MRRRNLGMLTVAAVGMSLASAAGERDAPAVEIVTSEGAMTVALWPDKAPRTVENFLALVDEGFYDGTIFHRVIAGFMIQGGGHGADMALREPGRTVENESVGGASNERWTIAMARTADPDSAGSQFYINVVDNKRLDARDGEPGYTVFGQLKAGHDVAEAIELAETGELAGMRDVPVAPIVIESARRVGKGASGEPEDVE